jgi:hypothetical protein
MSDNETNSGQDGKSTSNPFIWILAVIAFAFIKPSEALRNLAYKKADTDHLLGRALAYVVAPISAFLCGKALFTAGVMLFWCVLAALAAQLLTYYYVWPLMYLLLVRSSMEMWARVDNGWTLRQSWFTNFLLTASGFSLLAISIYLVWAMFMVVSTYIGSVSGLLGAISFVPLLMGVSADIGALVLGALLFGLFYLMRLYLVAFALGIGLAQWINPVLNAGAATSKANGTYWLIVSLFLAYGFPLVHIVMTHGFRRVHETLKRWREEMYTTPQSAPQKALLVLGSFPVAMVVAHALYRLGGMVHLPLLLSACLAIIGMFAGFNYLATKSITYGWSWFSQTTACVSGLSLAMYYWSYANFLGVYGVITGSVVAALLYYYALMPAVCATFRLCVGWALTEQQSENVLKAYDAIQSRMDVVRKSINKLNQSAYGTVEKEPIGYDMLLLHLCNIAAAVAVFYSAVKYVPVSMAAGAMVMVLGAVAALFTYLVFGALLLRWLKVSFLGFVSAFSFGWWAGYGNWGHTASMKGVAILWGVMVLCFVYSIAYPLLHEMVRKLFAAAPEFTNRLCGGLESMFTSMAKQFDVLWSAVSRVYQVISSWFGEIWKQVAQSMDEIWTQMGDIFKRKT